MSVRVCGSQSVCVVGSVMLYICCLFTQMCSVHANLTIHETIRQRKAMKQEDEENRENNKKRENSQMNTSKSNQIQISPLRWISEETRK